MSALGHTDTMPIIDRGLGQDVPAGAWDAVFYQATHDSSGHDIGFAPHWPALHGVRGAYHFARPGSSSGGAQAKLFCDRVLALGWRAKSDLWALDIEVDGLNGAALYQWIVDFMEYAKAKLGDRGFLYIGWPFYVTHVSHTNFDLLHRYRWWLPDYGRNDGAEHVLSAGEPFAPVLHQFTSIPFDKSSIVNATAWHELFVPEVIVRQQFNPPIVVVSKCLFHHPERGTSAADVQADGSVFCTPGDAYLGGANGQAYFRGRRAAEIVSLSPAGYTIIATSGEKYHFTPKP